MLQVTFSAVDEFMDELARLVDAGEVVSPLRLTNTYTGTAIGVLYKRSLTAGVVARPSVTYTTTEGDASHTATGPDTLVFLSVPVGDHYTGRGEADEVNRPATEEWGRIAATILSYAEQVGLEVRHGRYVAS